MIGERIKAVFQVVWNTAFASKKIVEKGNFAMASLQIRKEGGKANVPVE